MKIGLLFARNVAEALVSKGLATVIRYRADDDQRSSKYDLLLAAEERAKKKGVGLHSKKDPPIHRVADVSGVGCSYLFVNLYKAVIILVNL